MKTLSIQQPWASLLAEGVKTFEIRSWKTDHRGPLLIRASNQVMPWYDDKGKVVKLPTKCLLFVGDLVDVRPMRGEDRMGAMSPYLNDLNCWQIRFRHYVRPTPAAGQLKLYETPGASIIALDEGEMRAYHPKLQWPTRHFYRAEVVEGNAVVTDTLSGEVESVIFDFSNDWSQYSCMVSYVGYIGGWSALETNKKLGHKRIQAEMAASINQGLVWRQLDELPVLRIEK